VKDRSLPRQPLIKNLSIEKEREGKWSWIMEEVLIRFFKALIKTIN